MAMAKVRYNPTAWCCRCCATPCGSVDADGVANGEFRDGYLLCRFCLLCGCTGEYRTKRVKCGRVRAVTARLAGPSPKRKLIL